ncbi:MAG: hypothetical protein LBM99_02870 [Bacillales bacterium]|jgi:hypothetical protein|nr:hypothetical protein [Bacillales bacterium]
MAKRSGGKDYFGLGHLVSVILAIFPPIAWILGFLTRLKEGHLLAAIIRLVFGFTIVWILDLVLLILNGRILRVL